MALESSNKSVIARILTGGSSDEDIIYATVCKSRKKGMCR